MAHLSDVIKKPLLTEKSSKLTEDRNIYCFEVLRESTKIDIKNAVEKYFNVKVKKVRTINSPGKVKRRGRSVKKTAMIKKAYIQIESGQKIELFKGI